MEGVGREEGKEKGSEAGKELGWKGEGKQRRS